MRWIWLAQSTPPGTCRLPQGWKPRCAGWSAKSFCATSFGICVQHLKQGFGSTSSGIRQLLAAAIGLSLARDCRSWKARTPSLSLLWLQGLAYNWNPETMDGLSYYILAPNMWLEGTLGVGSSNHTVQCVVW